jgi:hypothetical protein
MLADWLERAVSRIGCRVLRRHDLGCRGRADHIRPDGTNIDPERWTR